MNCLIWNKRDKAEGEDTDRSQNECTLCLSNPTYYVFIEVLIFCLTQSSSALLWSTFHSIYMLNLTGELEWMWNCALRVARHAFGKIDG